ncbi:MAG: hypothetical protein EOM88_03950 [Clostridia bacterium]|nr:hypothetical protein [Clostridia bacterium]
MKKIEDRIILGITGQKQGDWESKIYDLDKLNINKAALFLSCCKTPWRKKVYDCLLNSKIKYIPMVHLRDDMDKKEIKFLFDNFQTRYFTIHQDHFNVIEKWRGYFKYLYLEFGLPLNKINKKTDINKIAGLCVDCSHYMFEKTANMIEAKYINRRKNNKNLFGCNHLNGYSYTRNADVHHLSSVNEFSYLKGLPRYIFGEVVGLEMENSIKEQLIYLKYIKDKKLLS